MGAWGTGLLESDHASSSLFLATKAVAADLFAEGSKEASRQSAIVIATILSLLVELRADLLEDDPELVKSICATRLGVIESGPVKEFLSAIAAVDDDEIVDAALRSAEASRSGLGGAILYCSFARLRTEPFASEYLERVTARCIADMDRCLLDGAFAAYDTRFAGYLAVLTVIAAGSVSAEAVDRWRRVLAAAVEAVADESDRLHFREFSLSVEAAFGVIERRAGIHSPNGTL